MKLLLENWREYLKERRIAPGYRAKQIEPGSIVEIDWGHYQEIYLKRRREDLISLKNIDLGPCAAWGFDMCTPLEEDFESYGGNNVRLSSYNMDAIKGSKVLLNPADAEKIIEQFKDLAKQIHTAYVQKHGQKPDAWDRVEFPRRRPVKINFDTLKVELL